MCIKKKNVYVSADYVRTVEDDSANSRFLRRLYLHRRLLNPIIEKEDENGAMFVFELSRLKRIRRFVKKDKKLLYVYRKLKDFEMPKCGGCGSEIFMRYPYTYRNNNGCVSKSVECSVCSSYSNEYFRKIQDFARNNGTKAALLMIKNDEKTDENDLPF